MDYLEFIKQSIDPETLARHTADFLQKQMDCPEFVLAEHKQAINPFTLLVQKGGSFDFEKWRESVREDTINPVPGDFIHHKEWFYFFSDTLYETGRFYFFLFSEKPTKQIKNVLTRWSQCTSLLEKSRQQVFEQNQVEQGSLIAQILHDMNTIITLQESEHASSDAAARIEYQKKANEDLLFYMRPLELMPFGVAVDQLIESSLQLCEIENNIFLLTISSELADISIDVELFSKAFNEIIWNAHQASENNSKIRITVNRIPSGSPFIAHDWLEISITDRGIGISKDYLEHIWEPFFTTRKASGRTGFGLTNAKKIITALQGFIELTSVKGQGTEVKIYLPYL